jgi:hypothetical protein
MIVQVGRPVQGQLSSSMAWLKLPFLNDADIFDRASEVSLRILLGQDVEHLLAVRPPVLPPSVKLPHTMMD